MRTWLYDGAPSERGEACRSCARTRANPVPRQPKATGAESVAPAANFDPTNLRAGMTVIHNLPAAGHEPVPLVRIEARRMRPSTFSATTFPPIPCARGTGRGWRHPAPWQRMQWLVGVAKERSIG